MYFLYIHCLKNPFSTIHGGEQHDNVVLTEDALHGPNDGLFMSVDSKFDLLHNKPDENNLKELQEKIRREKSDADLNEIASQERMEFLKNLKFKHLQDEAAKKEEYLQQKLNEIEEMKNKTPEQFVKDAVPVMTFPKENQMLIHHQQLAQEKMNDLRKLEKAKFDAQVKLAHLDDVTHKENPAHVDEDLKKRLENSYLKEEIPKIPVNPNNGNFFITKTSKDPNFYSEFADHSSSDSIIKHPDHELVDQTNPTNQELSAKKGYNQGKSLSNLIEFLKNLGKN